VVAICSNLFKICRSFLPGSEVILNELSQQMPESFAYLDSRMGGKILWGKSTGDGGGGIVKLAAMQG
jgi:hypothetical protein